MTLASHGEGYFHFSGVMATNAEPMWTGADTFGATVVFSFTPVVTEASVAGGSLDGAAAAQTEEMIEPEQAAEAEALPDLDTSETPVQTVPKQEEAAPAEEPETDAEQEESAAPAPSEVLKDSDAGARDTAQAVEAASEAPTNGADVTAPEESPAATLAQGDAVEAPTNEADVTAPDESPAATPAQGDAVEAPTNGAGVTAPDESPAATDRETQNGDAATDAATPAQAARAEADAEQTTEAEALHDAGAVEADAAGEGDSQTAMSAGDATTPPTNDSTDDEPGKSTPDAAPAENAQIEPVTSSTEEDETEE
jgi:hypothetical protein